jgi:hypothetical protein
MPYGLLENLTIQGYIDFNKIGTNYTNINAWKYYKYEKAL